MRQWLARMLRRPQPGFDRDTWAVAQAQAKEPFRGETVNEPHVHRRLQALRGLLVRIRLGDEGQRAAQSHLAAAQIRVEVAIERSHEMEERVGLAVVDARQNNTGVEPETTSERVATRDIHVERERARRERLQAAEELRLAAEAERATATALYVRLMEAATTGLERIDEYIAAYNVACTYERVRGIAPLPNRFAEQLVEEAIAVGGHV
jgi:hypothetical protein